MVSNYITVVYKFFLWAHRKQFLNVNSSKNKQPLAFKRRHAAAFSLYLLQSGYGGKKRENQKSQAKAGRAQRETCPVYISPGLGVALGPGAHLWGGTGGGVRSRAGVKGSARGAGSRLPTASADSKSGHSLLRTKRKGISQTRHRVRGWACLGRGAGAKGQPSPYPPPPTRPSEVAPTWRRMGFRLVSDLSSDRFLGKSGRRANATAHLARSLELAEAMFASPHPLAHSTLARTARANPTGQPAAPAYNSLGPSQRSKTHQVAAVHRAKTFRTPALRAASGGSGAGPL